MAVSVQGLNLQQKKEFRVESGVGELSVVTESCLAFVGVGVGGKKLLFSHCSVPKFTCLSACHSRFVHYNFPRSVITTSIM